MLDLSFIRQNLDQVRQKMQDRGMPMALDEFEALDLERRRLIQESESLKHLRNKTNDEISFFEEATAGCFLQDRRDEGGFGNNQIAG